MADAEHLHALDDALVRLRRLWSPGRPMLDEGEQQVEMSSVLVVEACARAAADRIEASVGDIARFLHVEDSTASRLIERAARAGFVDRGPSRHDARRAAVRLTDAGSMLRGRAVTHRAQWLAQTLSDWDESDIETLARLLGRFAAAVGHSAGP